MATRFTRASGLAIVIAAIALVGATGSAAQATPSGTLDQQHLITSGTWPGSQSHVPIMHQTFTAGVTGTLVRVDLPLRRNSDLVEGAAVDVFSTDSNGVPIHLNVPLAEATVPASALLEDQGQIVTFLFSQPAQLTAGKTYSLSVMSLSPDYGADHRVTWNQNDPPEEFLAGRSCSYDTDTEITSPTVNCSDTYDYGFATYMVAGGGSDKLPNTGTNTGTTLTLGGLATGALVAGSLIIWRRRARR